MGYGLHRHAGRDRQPRPRHQPGAPAGGAVRRRDDADHGGLRGAALGDGADARRARATGRSTSGSRRAPGRSTTAPLEALVDAGAVGFKIHEDYGAYPELIDHVLRFADAHDVSVSLHTDGLHESAELEDTVAAIAGRTVHAYHVEGDRRRPRARPARPRPRAERHLLVDDADASRSGSTRVAGAPADDRPQPRRLVRGAPSDVALVRERVHPATMAAEGPLHELGAIAIVNSDSQGMGRIDGDGPADDPARPRHEGLAGDRRPARVIPGLPPIRTTPFDDTERVLRYLAKVTIEPAIAHGIAGHVGSLPAGPARRHRPVEAGLLRGQAGARAQGRLPGLGAARRGQRHGRARRADPLPGRLGRRGRPRRGGCRVTFVSSRAVGDARPSPPGWPPAVASSSRSSGTRGLTRAALAREPRDRPDRDRPASTAASRSAGRPLDGRAGRPSCRSTGATGSASRRPRAADARDYQMSPTVKPSGNGSVGSTT